MGVKSNWMGLWKQREGLYKSYALTQEQIKKLPKKTRILLRYNKFYEADSNRPKFVFSFADAEAAESISFELQDYSGVSENVKRAKELIESALHDIRTCQECYLDLRYDDGSADTSLYRAREALDEATELLEIN